MRITPRQRRHLIDATGAARRLQALACAGYGTGYLAGLLVAHRLHVRSWQSHEHRQIKRSTHQRIDYTYQRLWDTDGGSTLARRHAAGCGWHPFEAWTDGTIDDPAAPPYSDPAQTSLVDPELLARVRAGRRPYADLSGTEKIELLTAHLRTGLSLRGFRNRYRPVPKPELFVLLALRPELWHLLEPHERQFLRLGERSVRLEDLRLAG